VTDALDRLKAAVADRYAVERELGAGGMANVYLAEDLRHHRKVALKVLRPEIARVLGDRFQREIETTAQLTHPHILPLLDSGDADGTLFYVMPYVEGESLRERLTREHQLQLDDAIQITREVADALSYAHRHGVLHRDIKPENILLESDHAVVADFGIARAIDQAGGERLTETGVTLGTPAYMSPEQAMGNRDLDGRSDVYSLGCMLYEMLSAETPYTGATPMAIMARKLADPLPRISVVRETVPPGVEAVLAKALARVPADRYATASEFAAALSAPTALTSSEAPRASRSPRRVAALATILLVIAAAAVVLLKTAVQGPSHNPSGGPLTSLVVLPLRNLSGDSTQEYFADGMTEALITELDKVSALTVISAHTAMLYKRSAKPTPEIARELHVQALVEGSVQRESGQVRITARLIDGRTDRRLWDSTYDREAAGVLALQAEVARAIARAIGARLTPEETRRLQVSRPVNPIAYDEYLLGRHDVALFTAEDISRAIAHYRRAIALDSTFVAPYAGLADAYWYLSGGFAFIPAREAAPLAEAAAERAVALDPGSAEAHAALAEVRYGFEWRWAEADSEYRRALELNSGLSDVHESYSMYLLYLGRRDEAVQHALRAVALDPLHADVREVLGYTYFYAWRFEESIAAEKETLELDSSNWFAPVPMAWSYSALGRHQEAIAAIGRVLKTNPADQIPLVSAAIIYARAGSPAIARRFLDSLTALGRKGWVDPYMYGWAYAWLGETDRALASLARSIDEHSTVVDGLKAEFLPERFKADPRYHALLRRIGLE